MAQWFSVMTSHQEFGLMKYLIFEYIKIGEFENKASWVDFGSQLVFDVGTKWCKSMDGVSAKQGFVHIPFYGVFFTDS